MSFLDRITDAFDVVPREETLGRIQVVPQGRELSEETIHRLHSDQSLTTGDKQALRKWADVHGYDPDLLAQEKQLRLIEDCDYLNHRPIKEHWQVECKDSDVPAPPDELAGWFRREERDGLRSPTPYMPCYWRRPDDHVVYITGRYGDWTVTHNVSGRLPDVLVTGKSAADSLAEATRFMRRHGARGAFADIDVFAADEFPTHVNGWTQTDRSFRPDEPLSTKVTYRTGDGDSLTVLSKSETPRQLEPETTTISLRIRYDRERIQREMPSCEAARQYALQWMRSNPAQPVADPEPVDPFADADPVPTPERETEMWPPDELFADST